ncbi:hypothetical protein GUJ93_ZPchr0002g24043 [Zizania palustris]|uniref:Uncharacterized protein n=1 Tax=Zizania palustris TaxID=103762 RepID=A0A8J5RZR8_ZIZPA|nr:hypothetical protein GUJ93_ZPchr0002g24043 [Zizania palustris]
MQLDSAGGRLATAASLEERVGVILVGAGCQVDGAEVLVVGHLISAAVGGGDWVPGGGCAWRMEKSGREVDATGPRESMSFRPFAATAGDRAGASLSGRSNGLSARLSNLSFVRKRHLSFDLTVLNCQLH